MTSLCSAAVAPGFPMFSLGLPPAAKDCDGAGTPVVLGRLVRFTAPKNEWARLPLGWSKCPLATALFADENASNAFLERFEDFAFLNLIILTILNYSKSFELGHTHFNVPTTRCEETGYLGISMPFHHLKIMSIMCSFWGFHLARGQSMSKLSNSQPPKLVGFQLKTQDWILSFYLLYQNFSHAPIFDSNLIWDNPTWTIFCPKDSWLNLMEMPTVNQKTDDTACTRRSTCEPMWAVKYPYLYPRNLPYSSLGVTPWLSHKNCHPALHIICFAKEHRTALLQKHLTKQPTMEDTCTCHISVQKPIDSINEAWG